MINRVIKAEDERHLVYLGGFLGYSFLTKTCFGVDFANCFWKQVLGHKLLAEDIGELDQQAFDKLRSEHDCEPSKPCLNLQKQIEVFFEAYRAGTDLVRSGMDQALGHKLHVIAYLPIKQVQDRIRGQSIISVEILRSIAVYKSNEEDEELNQTQQEWFWKMVEDFTP